MAACGLHNYLRLTENASYCPSGFVDCESSSGEVKHGKWRTVVAGEPGAFLDAPAQKGHRQKKTALQVREALKDYVNSDAGSVEWQMRMVGGV